MGVRKVQCIDRKTQVSKHTNCSIFNDSDKPPVAVAIVEEDHSVPLRGICLAINGGNEGMQSIDELEVNVL